MFGACIIHILYTECAKIKKIIPAPKRLKHTTSQYISKTSLESCSRYESVWLSKVPKLHQLTPKHAHLNKKVRKVMYICMYVCNDWISDFCLCYIHWSGPASVVGIATGYGLDGTGIESRRGRDFPHLSRPTLGHTQPPVQWVPGLSRGKRAAGAWRWTLTLF